jgi:hypothetical protein
MKAMTSRKWTEAELMYLEKNYPSVLTRDIAKALGRSYVSVNRTACRYGFEKEAGWQKLPYQKIQ